VAYDWNALVARAVAQIQTITDIGNVYDRLRFPGKDAGFEDIVGATIGGEKKLRVWMVSIGADDAGYADSSGRLEWPTSITIEGFLQLEDGADSQAIALSLAQSIVRTLAADYRATRLGDTVLTAKPPKLTANELRGFAGLATHYVKLTMPVLGMD
jgi:hypothetical protein